MRELVQASVDLWHQGGFVMPWLVGSTVVLWWAIGERAYTLWFGGLVGEGRARIQRLPPDALHPGRVAELTGDLLIALDRHRALIAGLAATAPLVGLLGTVSGMIETFDSLATMSMHSNTGGIAGGISEALVSTQMGLSVAIPGLLAGRLLERAQQKQEDELAGLAPGSR
jgi:biopolymer transport protein ExbB